MYFEMEILVIWNNHEFGVLMNGNVKCVEKKSKNNECVHVKWKFVVTIVWNNYERINLHIYQQLHYNSSCFYNTSVIGRIAWITTNAIHRMWNHICM
jgi:hypothetical protein